MSRNQGHLLAFQVKSINSSGQGFAITNGKRAINRGIPDSFSFNIQRVVGTDFNHKITGGPGKGPVPVIIPGYFPGFPAASHDNIDFREGHLLFIFLTGFHISIGMGMKIPDRPDFGEFIQKPDHLLMGLFISINKGSMPFGCLIRDSIINDVPIPFPIPQ